MDLKQAEGKARFLELVTEADALIEGGRPGVMERLDLGPDVCRKHNPKLIYGRVTGWGRSGPEAHTAGHDINYIALSGALHACGYANSAPAVPLNLVGDFGGGGLMLAFGMLAALFEAKNSGLGQTVDAAMVDGAGVLMSMIYGMRANGRWPAPRAGNILDGSAYFYSCYECSDGNWMAVGAIEPQFRRILLEGLGLSDEIDGLMRAANDDPTARARIAEKFRQRSRAEWQAVFDGSDACVTPVLAMSEVLDHPQNKAWGSFQLIDGTVHPSPAPRFSRTPVPEIVPKHRQALLEAWGLEKTPVQA